MFRRRSTLQKQDHDSGLAFSWRVPVSSTMSFVVAFLLVGIVAVLLAVAVRVRVGKERVLRDTRATVTLVPSGAAGDALLRMAKEAGPYPFRSSLFDKDGSLFGDEIAPVSATDPGYVPELSAMEMSSLEEGGQQGNRLQVLPPLPVSPSRPAIEPEREMTLGVSAVGDADGAQLLLASLSIPAAEAATWRGQRYLVGYDDRGRVTEVVPLVMNGSTGEGADWIRRGRVEMEKAENGWMVIEFVQQP